ncbi:MAG: BLI-3 blue-light-inducible Bli-3 protein [Caeruleum heppii]|nr:MAG: BLI-3 blue-light-inducible Bli-3 protein [Caeruleum heppii]
MSGNTFSNADTGNKPADPYKAKNLDQAPLKDKVQDLVSFVEGCKFGMMTTKESDKGLLVSRCMAMAGKETGGIDLVFTTNTESGKTDDLHTDPNINIAFINGSGEWASIAGKAEVLTDRDVVKKYYSRQLKAWLGDLGDGKHDGGPDDPRIGAIRVNAVTATYAIADRNMVSRGIEIAKGTVTGDTAQVNKLRELSEEDINTCKHLPFDRPERSCARSIAFDLEPDMIAGRKSHSMVQ